MLSRLVAAVPEPVLGLCRRLRQCGKRGWVVGGSVRDLLLGRPVQDWDVATDARPRQMMRFFARVVPTGIRHGTVTVLVGDAGYEVTTLRGEHGYGDGRRPDRVEFHDDIARDLARRDFTINAIALDPIEPCLVDPFGGRADLARRVLRAVGEARERFAEDGLRILRAARFAATLGCRIEPDTLRAMGEKGALETFAKVSAERVRDEWLKALSAARPSVAFEIMRETGMLAIVGPELLALHGCRQNRHHLHDAWQHTMLCVDACQGDAVLRLAALLHDVGKPATRAVSEKTGDHTFYSHEEVGATMAEAILRRLKLSGADRERVVHIVRHHLVCYSQGWTDAAVRRFLRRVTPERTEDVFQLALADVRAKGGDEQADTVQIEKLRARIAAVAAEGSVLSARDLDIDGHALMRELGLGPGPLIGELLDALVELVTEEPGPNERGKLLDAARAHLAGRAHE
ncbi:MAG: HD domain-containing protein [Deltaproteobacteria bacterium]|nr:HD domain-containing protein [Deltaproteobacteria bacterium]